LKKIHTGGSPETPEKMTGGPPASTQKHLPRKKMKKQGRPNSYLKLPQKKKGKGRVRKKVKKKPSGTIVSLPAATVCRGRRKGSSGRRNLKRIRILLLSRLSAWPETRKAEAARKGGEGKMV